VDYAQLLTDNLGLIDQIVRTVGRRRHLSLEEIDDLAGHVRLQLVEDDYGVLRKFKGRSSFSTYLTIVIERMTLDYLDRLWGRWRPSKMAERLGPVAVQLERLVIRDAHALDEAIEMLRTNHGVTLTVAELHDLWEKLPVRVKDMPIEEEAAAALASSQTADATIEHAERQTDVVRLERALASALDQCTNAERVLLSLRYEYGLKVGDVARVIGASPATVHRQLAGLLPRLRTALEASGLSRERILRLIGEPRLGISSLLRSDLERVSKFVRLSRRDG
jgi:RNA polymerase sigma factor (sigma-70 family)